MSSASAIQAGGPISPAFEGMISQMQPFNRLELITRVIEKRNNGVLFKDSLARTSEKSEAPGETLPSQSKKPNWFDKAINFICCRQMMNDSSPILVTAPQRQVLQMPNQESSRKDSLQKPLPKITEVWLNIIITSPDGHSRVYSPHCTEQQGENISKMRPGKILDIHFKKDMIWI